MDTWSTCFNCGEPGHYAESCDQPDATAGRQPGPWQHRPQRARDEQARINAEGMAKVRAALNG